MSIPQGGDVQELYDQYIEGVVINYKGEVVTTDADGKPVTAEGISPRKEYKKKNVADKLFPVYQFKSEVNIGSFDAYIIPVYGNGLWDEIWGFVAIGPDFNTIEGTSFDHKGETPGLGARITTDDFEARFKGKKIFEGSDLASVHVVKGEGNPVASDEFHKVDGLSGASMTTGGLNEMLENYFGLYKNYFEKSRSGSVTTVDAGSAITVEDLLNHK